MEGHIALYFYYILCDEKKIERPFADLYLLLTAWWRRVYHIGTIGSIDNT